VLARKTSPENPDELLDQAAQVSCDGSPVNPEISIAESLSAAVPTKVGRTQASTAEMSRNSEVSMGVLIASSLVHIRLSIRTSFPQVTLAFMNPPMGPVDILSVNPTSWNLGVPGPAGPGGPASPGAPGAPSHSVTRGRSSRHRPRRSYRKHGLTRLKRAVKKLYRPGSKRRPGLPPRAAPGYGNAPAHYRRSSDRSEGMP
jgi:hypothetical protein